MIAMSLESHAAERSARYQWHDRARPARTTVLGTWAATAPAWPEGENRCDSRRPSGRCYPGTQLTTGLTGPDIFSRRLVATPAAE